MSNAHHEYQKAKARNKRYKNKNPKNRLESVKFSFRRWWRND